jgi:hypothetical protein
LRAARCEYALIVCYEITNVDLDLPPDYGEFLREWAEALSVSVEVLLSLIVIAMIDGELYVEKIPDYKLKPPDNLVKR